MKIQALQTQVFQGGNKRRTNTDRAATVKDLYESEDRIIANQKKLIEQQNAAFSEALMVIMDQHSGAKEVSDYHRRSAANALYNLPIGKQD